jgi:D-alanyl-lipoteichoic acid acyltransferase DltB (MBOAT superfamily)
MQFNSGVFLQFFGAFLLLYWLVRDHLRTRNLLIVAASYFFYGWWDWRFLALLFFSSSFDFCVGLGLERLTDPRQRRALLAGSIVVNLGILSVFKYGNFFLTSLAALLERLHVPFHPGTLSVILPVGISFYTFQSMSYALDVYRREIQPTRSFINFLAFVSFFPQLAAGPIQRARHLLPQFERTVVITQAMLEEGVWLIAWGLFKKVVVADNLAPLVDLVFGQSAHHGPPVLLGTIAFGLQIYGDFSGYSDIARGLARVLGFDMVWNFDLPYASQSVREFWRRWHISLSNWLRDYLYFSLGGSRRGPSRTLVNLMLTMALGGLWHGAAWNFVLWGCWHGAGLAVQRLWTRARTGSSPAAGAVPSRSSSAAVALSIASWGLTMAFVFYGWLLFRAHSWEQIAAMTRALIDPSLPPWTASLLINLAAYSVPLIAVELWQFWSNDRLVALRLPRPLRWMAQGFLAVCITLFWERKEIAFLYFQF